MVGTMAIDRLAQRLRPPRLPVLHQRWTDLAMLHWEVDPRSLARIVPRGVELDLHDGRAWVGLTPFRVTRLRATGLPPLPFVGRADEVNLRIYVHRDGVPGVWFPSLEITSRLAQWGARIGWRMPYFHARMHVQRGTDGGVSFASTRESDAAAMLDVGWRPDGAPQPPAAPGSLEFFVAERYVLYAADRGRVVLRARIHHRPWTLRRATLVRCRQGLLRAAGIDVAPDAPPAMVHAQVEPIDAAVWLPTCIGNRDAVVRETPR